MSFKTRRWFIMSLFFTLLLVGCACDDTGHNEFNVIQDAPPDQSILSSLIPTFGWHDEESCTPDKFLITVAKIDGSYSNYASPPGNTSSFTWPTSLDPGSQYKWRMRVNADNGPTGPYTEDNIFYTGPMCSGGVLVAPELVSPGTSGWISHNDMQTFRWSYPGGCLPAAYDYEFATDAAFTNVVDSGTTPDYQMWVEKTFPNCSTIFWRVRVNDGISTGPWSDTGSFHWVTDETCWQNHYISDDAARIAVRLYHDQCSLTGYQASTQLLTDSGCKVDNNGVTLVGDGERTYPPDSHIGNFEVDLGSGPCPSTGLDHKTSPGWYIFNVLAPGTYCLSVTRNQIVGYGSTNLMHGIWTDPRTTDNVAYKTIELGPGTSDLLVYFGWDEYDRVFVMPRLPETKYCRICPDPIGPVVDILMEGSLVELFGRDSNSEWKLTYAQGVPCYLWLSDEKINLDLSRFEDFDWRAEDLEFFPQSAPCPKPETKPDTGPAPAPAPASQPSCSDYDERQCIAHATDGCKWNRSSLSCDGP